MPTNRELAEKIEKLEEEVNSLNERLRLHTAQVHPGDVGALDVTKDSTTITEISKRLKILEVSHPQLYKR